MPAPVERCNLCKHYVESDGRGYCRRYPPKSDPTVGQSDYPLLAAVGVTLPRTVADHWCGEFRAA